MALDRKNLRALVQLQDFGLWHYTTTDSAADIDTAGYFNEMSGKTGFGLGTVIFVNADTDGTPAYGILTVISDDGSTVDTADMLATAAVDTD